jgi:hypothetical protein
MRTRQKADRKSGGSRSAPLLTLLYALSFARSRPRREAVPASEFRPGKK